MEEFGLDEWREGILLTPAQHFATFSDCPVYCFCFVTKMEQNVTTSERRAGSSETTCCPKMGLSLGRSPTTGSVWYLVSVLSSLRIRKGRLRPSEATVSGFGCR